MPTALVTISDVASWDETAHADVVRRAVAVGLDCVERALDETHVSVRLAHGKRATMLADVEVEVFGQSFESRVANRDTRANQIARMVSEGAGFECACWINLGTVGYSRVTTDGMEFYSD